MKALVKTDQLTSAVISAAIEVHKHLGPGLLESAYEECLCHEFAQQGLLFQRQVPLPINYKGVQLDCGYRLDIVVNDELPLELKAAAKILPVHQAQMLTYLKLKNYRRGLIINFNVSILKDGVKRMVNDY